MSRNHSEKLLVLGIAPSSHGVGYAVMNGKGHLIDWGVKAIRGDKNVHSLTNVADLIAQNEPTVIALENPAASGTRRSSRIQTLVQEIVAFSREAGIKVTMVSRKQVRKGLFSEGTGTKYAVAEQLAARFPEDLAFRVPKKRRPWTSEASSMDIFDAVALAEHIVRSVPRGARRHNQ